MDNQGLLEKSDITISFPSKPHRKNEDSGTPIPTLVGNLIVGVPIMRIMELVGVFDSFSYNEALHDFVPSEGGGICGGYGVTVAVIRQGSLVAEIHLWNSGYEKQIIGCPERDVLQTYCNNK